MNVSALQMLQNVVAKTVIAVDVKDTKRILDEGFEAVSNEFAFAYDNLSESDMLRLKDGDNLFEPALSTYAKIQMAVGEMIAAKQMRIDDKIRYAALTGHDLDSKTYHEADATIKVRKAIIDGHYIAEPLVRKAQEVRNICRIDYDAMRAGLSQTLVIVKTLPTVEQEKLKPIVDNAYMELENKKQELSSADAFVVELLAEAKNLEKEYAFTFDETGKRVYNKDSEFNKWYGANLKLGRTAITEFKKFEKIYGIDKVVNLGDIDKARRVLGL